MNDLTDQIDRLLERNRGIIKLTPNYVARYYMDGGRLGLAGDDPGATYRPQVNRWVPERWIASTISASQPNPQPGEGLSVLEIEGETDALPGALPNALPITLKEALEVRGPDILGDALFGAYGPEFPVLNKILDPHHPIVFHFHARDQDVQNFPRHFAGHKHGKEEAYYFLPRRKGPVPYMHLGLFPGVTRQDLERAAEQGGDYALELSPVALQRFEQGMYVPAGAPHRPGTALTLEIQQPADISLHLEWDYMGKRKPPEQTHPGFESMAEALRFVDIERACEPDVIEKNRLVPELVAETRQRGQGEEHWIFPPRVTPKFSGKRVRVTGVFETPDPPPYALLVWRGRGELNGMTVGAGDEFLVTARAAASPLRLTRLGDEVLEVFKLFPPRA